MGVEEVIEENDPITEGNPELYEVVVASCQLEYGVSDTRRTYLQTCRVIHFLHLFTHSADHRDSLLPTVNSRDHCSHAEIFMHVIDSPFHHAGIYQPIHPHPAPHMGVGVTGRRRRGTGFDYSHFKFHGSLPSYITKHNTTEPSNIVSILRVFPHVLASPIFRLPTFV